jgi:hypothetical protein
MEESARFAYGPFFTLQLTDECLLDKVGFRSAG